jgi:hypothetical protein
MALARGKVSDSMRRVPRTWIRRVVAAACLLLAPAAWPHPDAAPARLAADAAGTLSGADDATTGSAFKWTGDACVGFSPDGLRAYAVGESAWGDNLSEGQEKSLVEVTAESSSAVERLAYRCNVNSPRGRCDRPVRNRAAKAIATFLQRRALLPCEKLNRAKPPRALKQRSGFTRAYYLLADELGLLVEVKERELANPESSREERISVVGRDGKATPVLRLVAGADSGQHLDAIEHNAKAGTVLISYTEERIGPTASQTKFKLLTGFTRR